MKKILVKKTLSGINHSKKLTDSNRKKTDSNADLQSETEKLDWNKS